MTEPLSPVIERKIRGMFDPNGHDQFTLDRDELVDATRQLLAEVDRLRPLLPVMTLKHRAEEAEMELAKARAWMADPYNPRHIAQAVQHTTARCDEAVTRIAAERDAVYRERAHLVAALAVEYPSVLVDAADVDEDGWKIVYITLSTGQCSWHIAPTDLDLFEHVDTVGSQDERAQWDQHTTEEKYQRIREHVARTADESYQAWADEGKAATYEHDPDEGKDLDYDEPPF